MIQAFESMYLGKKRHISYLAHETKTHIVAACDSLRQPFRNYHSGLLFIRGSATPRSAKEMLNGQRQSVDVPAHAGTAHDGRS